MPVPEEAPDPQPRLLQAACSPTPRIVSASRRTDIPAHFSEWLLRRIAAGHCLMLQPFSRRWVEVSLRPEDVLGMVLWTRNIGPLLLRLEELTSRYALYVQFTVTGFGPELEPGTLATDAALAQLRELAQRLGPDGVVWRFDPIIHTQHGGAPETVERFQRLADHLAGSVRDCVTSFMSPYRRQERAFKLAGLEHHELAAEERLSLAERLTGLAVERGMSLGWCCCPDVAAAGYAQAHCIDVARLVRLGAAGTGGTPPGPSREGCGCARCVDIGAYDLCGAGCRYCYANQSHAAAARNLTRHCADHLALAQALPGVPDPEPR